MNLNQLYGSHLDFVRFRLPESQSITTWYHPPEQTKWIASNQLLASEGFVVAPFLWQRKVQRLLPLQHSGVAQNAGTEHLNAFPTSVSKKSYMKKARTYLEHFQSGELEKAILSRVVEVDSKAFNLEECFNTLISRYPNAFVYCFRTQEQGCWMGATPEVLLNANGGAVETVALAGTRPIDEQPPLWTQKEIKEQEWVAQFIRSVAQKLSITFNEGERFTASAGPVQHLKTRFSMQDVEANQVLELLEQLHPTPAVCGHPRNVALELIARVEGFDRSCYAGFLGPVSSNRLELYVNLRCMQIFSEKLALYVGGGLTRDSDPEQEWLETVEKSKTLRSVIDAAQKATE